MRHLKLFENWKWLGDNSGEDSDEDRELVTTVDKILNWAVGPDWKENYESLMDIIMVDEDWPSPNEWIGYHQLLKRSADKKIEIYSQLVDGQIFSNWRLGETEFSIVSDEWPFEEDEKLTQEEEEAYQRLSRELEPEFKRLEANNVDLIDFIMELTRKGKRPRDLSASEFSEWIRFKRSYLN